MSNDLFPHSDQIGETMILDSSVIVAFDLDGDRYCVECSKEMDEIDCERFHNNPYSVPAGGSVLKQHMRETDHTYHCGNSDCGKEIPGQQ